MRALASIAAAPNQRTFIAPMELASTRGGIGAIAAAATGESRATGERMSEPCPYWVWLLGTSRCARRRPALPAPF